MLPPTPAVQRIPYSAPRADFISALEKDGCVVVQNFTDLDTLAQAKREVQPYLDAEDKASKVGALEGRTKTCTRLIGRSTTDLVEHFLTLRTQCWYGNEPAINVSNPLLSIAITMDIQPGTPAQRLHRDDKNHHARHAPVDAYHPNRDMLLGLFVPGCDTYRENGATRVIPGSHLWGDGQPDFGPDGTKGVVDACLNAGDAFIMLGSLYHGGGEYSQKDGSRTMHIMFCCSGVYRQEEISFLSYPIEDVKTYPQVVKDRLGWKQSEPNLGWVDLQSPEYLLE
ncbi:Phytanoyl-CoA dioxygenase [Neofusicoccum parvum]|uniref:Putative phytanoyl-dioxygenase family protein n=1 Tax=Botryosphaeria parva (strain UCR-NP2) TaxID=1287680 RepID=R1EU87_BOTPV|nr:putative phytanoyl- dioxygenase family protein [Neofusicoccum parvum UCRNP2]GME56200.1 Phytanoyl-CoA dioxygenase [Neofusicoccum parvum]